MKKITLGAIIIVLALFGLSVAMNNNVFAQIRGFGAQCIPNYATCGVDSINMQEIIDGNKLKINGGISQSDFIKSIEDTYTGAEDLGRLCVSKSYLNTGGDLSIFDVNRDGSDQNQIPNSQDSNVYDVDLIADLVPRTCGQDRNLLQFENNVANEYSSYSAGCCPSNYVLVGKSRVGNDRLSTIVSNRTHAAACCLRPLDNNSDNQPNEYENIGGTLTCFNGKGIYQTRLAVTYGPGQVQNKVIEDPEVRGLPFGVRGVAFPQTITIQARSGSESKCVNAGGCAMVPSNTPGASTYQTQANLEVGVLNPALLQTQTGLQCNLCYEIDEAMFLTQAVVGGTPTQLAVCTGAGAVTLTNLVNNNIADTLASRSLSGDNRSFVVNCRAQGSNPTAIGCIDTTPLGIITGAIRVALGTMGGVALLQLILVGLIYQQGKEDKIKEAREKFLATLTGLAVLVFSVLILRVLGVNILDVIPAGTI